MLVHISTQHFPLRVTATQRGKKMKIVMLFRQTLKLVAIVNVLLVARAEEQPELVSLMTGAFCQQRGQHGAERRDPGSGGNEHGVTQRRTQNEIAERSRKHKLRAFVEIAAIVEPESIRHCVP